MTNKMLPLVPSRPADREEEMVAEFVGGPWDGMRVKLRVVEEGIGRMRILETAYAAIAGGGITWAGRRGRSRSGPVIRGRGLG